MFPRVALHSSLHNPTARPPSSLPLLAALPRASGRPAQIPTVLVHKSHSTRHASSPANSPRRTCTPGTPAGSSPGSACNTHPTPECSPDSVSEYSPPVATGSIPSAHPRSTARTPAEIQTRTAAPPASPACNTSPCTPLLTAAALARRARISRSLLSPPPPATSTQYPHLSKRTSSGSGCSSRSPLPHRAPPRAVG